MYDDDTDAEPKIISASFADPFLLLLRDDSSIFVAQCDDNNDLEEIEREDDTILATKWLTGCLYAGTAGVFTGSISVTNQEPKTSILMFLLSANGALYVSEPLYFLSSLLTKLRRFMLYPTFQSLFMLQKGYASSLLFYQQSMQQEGLPREKQYPKSLLLILAMRFQNLHTL